MFKSKFLNAIFRMMLSSLSLVWVDYSSMIIILSAQANKSDKPNIDEITKNLTVDTDEITTNLKSNTVY